MANLDEQRPGSLQLEHALFTVLQGGHLTAEERLACFCVSKGIAELVLRHAACTCLSLPIPDASPAATPETATTGKEAASATTSGQATAHAEAAQQLAALSGNVTLALHGGLLKPAACLWQSITTIQLHGLELSQISGSELQLHRLPRLHTLSLRHCRLAPSATTTTTSSSSSSSQQDRSTSVRTLECLNFSDSQLLSAAVQWVDPSQLQTVITDHASITTLLPQLPALQELHICDTSSSYDTVCDEGFQQLLAHPRLTRMQLAWVRLSHSHADKPCTWNSLHLSRGVLLTSLARMPLAGLQSCILHGYSLLDVPDSLVAAAISNISRAQNLVFQPCPATACMWMLPDPSFDVSFYDDVNAEMSAYALALAMRCVPPGTTLTLRQLALGSPEVRASLAAAPATMTTVCFIDCTSVENGGAATPGVLTLMPHVTHVVLRTVGNSPADFLVQAKLMGQLRLVLTGVVRPLQLTLVVSSINLVPWELAQQQGVHQWVRAHANNHVQVTFRCHLIVDHSLGKAQRGRS